MMSKAQTNLTGWQCESTEAVYSFAIGTQTNKPAGRLLDNHGPPGLLN